jgi:hypothetical protein
MNKYRVFSVVTVVISTAFIFLLMMGLAQAQTGSGPDQPIPIDNSTG